MVTLTIEEVQQAVRLGCTTEERAFPQVVAITIELDVDADESCRSDRVSDTVDYVDVVAAVERLAAESEWKLLEKMSYDIAAEILAAFTLVERARVTSRKRILPQVSGITATVELDRDSARF